jgi:hypothetical protein
MISDLRQQLVLHPFQKNQRWMRQLREKPNGEDRVERKMEVVKLL